MEYAELVAYPVIRIDGFKKHREAGGIFSEFDKF
jgi:hypothetical protein